MVIRKKCWLSYHIYKLWGKSRENGQAIFLINCWGLKSSCIYWTIIMCCRVCSLTLMLSDLQAFLKNSPPQHQNYLVHGWNGENMSDLPKVSEEVIGKARVWNQDYLMLLLHAFKKKKLFIWLCRVLVAACKIFSCSMRILRCCVWDLVLRPGNK